MRALTQPSLNTKIFLRLAFVGCLALLAVAAAVYCLPATISGSLLFRWILVLIGLLTTIWFTLRTATKPLERMLEQLAKIQNSQDSKLRVEGSANRELVELAGGCNSLLSEVQQANASQEELRTVKEHLASARQLVLFHSAKEEINCLRLNSNG